MFGSLHTRSHMSFLDGASSPEDLVATAAALGHHAIALTDVYGVYGAVRLERACTAHNIKPLMGCDVVMDGITVSLIAMYYQGTSICDANATSLLDDCIAIIHGTGHDVQDVRTLADRVHSYSVYIGISHDARPWSRRRTTRLVDLARELELPIVVAQDVRYATADCYAVHDLMTY